MKTIGITGGVGAGKSTVLDYLQTHCRCRLILTDVMARELQEPERPLYTPVLDLLEQICTDLAEQDPVLYAELCREYPGETGIRLTNPRGQIDRPLMARLIFRDDASLEKVNALVHPAVIREIEKEMEQARNSVEPPEFFIVESALLVDSGLADIFDSVWYIYCREEVRRERLRASRGYSDERIDSILKSQLPDEVFRARCDVVIDNSGTEEETCRQVEAAVAAERI